MPVLIRNAKCRAAVQKTWLDAHVRAGGIDRRRFTQEETMKTEPKLAPMWGTLEKLHLLDVVSTARRALRSTMERWAPRPLRDIDGWSDQAEVAFYEEQGRCA